MQPQDQRSLPAPCLAMSGYADVSRGLILLLSGLGLGCQSVAEQAAVLSAPSAATQAELQSVISEMLDGTPVRLAEDAFAGSSLLTLEHAPPGSIDGQFAGSRTVETPEQFKLLVSGSGCHLLRVRTGEQRVLPDLRCQPAPAKP